MAAIKEALRQTGHIAFYSATVFGIPVSDEGDSQTNLGSLLVRNWRYGGIIAVSALPIPEVLSGPRFYTESAYRHSSNAAAGGEPFYR